MAYIHQYSENKAGKLSKQIVLLFVIGIVFVAVMTATSKNLTREWFVIGGVAAFMVGIFLLVSYRTNPMMWLKLFKPRKYLQIKLAIQKVTEQLEKLDDRCFAFNRLMMEFFQIDQLVVTPHGIFVIADMEAGDFSLSPEDTLLYQGKPQEKLVAKLWRTSHMINIIIKKGFETDIMPVPLIVATEAETVSVSEFKRIRILPVHEISSFIQSRKQQVDQNLVEGFVRFVSQRYVLRNRLGRKNPGENK